MSSIWILYNRLGEKVFFDSVDRIDASEAFITSDAPGSEGRTEVLAADETYTVKLLLNSFPAPVPWCIIENSTPNSVSKTVSSINKKFSAVIGSGNDKDHYFVLNHRKTENSDSSYYLIRAERSPDVSPDKTRPNEERAETPEKAIEVNRTNGAEDFSEQYSEINSENADAVRSIKRHLRFNRPIANKWFVGREYELDRITENYSRGYKIQVLRGQGGMGKTQIALQYSYLHDEDYEVIHWVDGRSLESIENCYASFLRNYKKDFTGAARDEVRQAYTDYMEALPSWLIIYDNCDFYDKKELRYLVNHCLPQGNGHILITSRDIRAVGNSESLEVHPFDLPLASRFLMDRSGDPCEEDAKKLAERLGCFPLALEVAGAYIAAVPSCTTKKYLGYLSKDIGILDDTENIDSYSHTMTEIITLTMAHIKEKEDTVLSTCLEELMRISAFSFPDGIDLNAFGEYFSDPRRSPSDERFDCFCEYCSNERSRDKLEAKAVQYALLKYNGRFLSIHPLLQELIRNKMPGSLFERYNNKIITVYSYIVSQTDPDDYISPNNDNGNKNRLYSSLLLYDHPEFFENALERELFRIYVLCEWGDNSQEVRADLKRYYSAIKGNYVYADLGWRDLLDIGSRLNMLIRYFGKWIFSVSTNSRDSDRETAKEFYTDLEEVLFLSANKLYSVEMEFADLNGFLSAVILALMHYNDLYLETDDDIDGLSNSVTVLCQGLKVVDYYVKSQGTDEYVIQEKKHTGRMYGSYVVRFTDVLLPLLCKYMKNGLFFPELTECFDSYIKILTAWANEIANEEANTGTANCLKILNAYRKQDRTAIAKYLDNPDKAKWLFLADADFLDMINGLLYPETH